ncbi:MAG: glycosyltransferase family 2 protein [Spirochaetota bacterium]
MKHTPKQLKYLLSIWRDWPRLVWSVVKVTVRFGPAAVLQRAKAILPRVIEEQTVSPTEVAKLGGKKPLISVILPTYNTPIKLFRDAVASVFDQVYTNWELIVVDDASESAELLALLKNLSQQDPRVNVYFRLRNGNISRAINDGLKRCRGTFFTILDHDDRLSRNALYYVAKAIIEQPKVDIIYSDEDKLSADGTVRTGAFFKPDWSPEYIHTFMYTCHLLAYRTRKALTVGSFDSRFDGAQDFDYFLRFTEKSQRIFHIPHVLYHWRIWAQSTASGTDAKPYAFERAHKALRNHLTRTAEQFELQPSKLPGHHDVTFLPRRADLISIVIPTANGGITIGNRLENHIDTLIRQILDESSYQKFEIVIAHNGNLTGDQLAFFEDQQKVKLYHYQSVTFNLAEKINKAASECNGNYLLLLNDDIRVISKNWLERMLGMAQRKGVGAVAPKLLFHNGRVQHAGIVLLQGMPGHPFYGEPDGNGYGLGIRATRNCIAVTGACKITPAKLFHRLNGYDSAFPMNYNDVDYCLRARELGYRSVYLANVSMYHYEGVSKGTTKQDLSHELVKFRARWAQKYPHDPYYNPNLHQFIPYR